MAGRATQATAVLEENRVPYVLHPYEHDARSTAYGTEAVDALGLPARRVFKTLVVEVDGAAAVCVVPVARQLDLKRAATALDGKRARLADAAVAQRLTGYVVGGISPLGGRKRLPTVIDSSARRFDTIYCSAGRRGLQLEIAPADLIGLTDAVLSGIAAG